jgi:glutathione S-transferase
MNDTNVIVHQYRVSPFAAKVRRACYYKGISFETRNLSTADMGAIKKMSSSGKTPVLEHKGQFIIDSTDIIRYLDQAYDGRRLIPEDPLARAQAHIFEDWADESLYFYDLTMRSWPNNARLLGEDLVMDEKKTWRKKLLRPLMPKLIAKQAAPQGIARKSREVVCREAALQFDAIEAITGQQDYLVGKELSVADIAVVSMCTVLERAEEARDLMEARPALMAWRERIDSATLPAGTEPGQRALV